MNRLRRTSQRDATWLGCWIDGGSVRSVYAPEPPLLFFWFHRLRCTSTPLGAEPSQVCLNWMSPNLPSPASSGTRA